MSADPVRYEPSTEPIDREPRGYPYLSKENEALLRDTLATAGVELGEWDDLILRWLAKWEFGTVAVVASWIVRTARSGPASAGGESSLAASASLQPRTPAPDGTVGTPAVSAGARYASAKQTRAALRRHQDAWGTGRGPDGVAEHGHGR
jgi:hypothetical protein